MTTESPATGSVAIRTVVAATFASTLAILPAFLVGALAVTIRQDLGFSRSGLGVVVAAFWLVMAVTGAPGGRAVQRMGASRSIRAASVGSLISLLAASTSRSLIQLVLWLVVGGLASGIAQPAADLALARAVPTLRRGLAFGIKQASVPGAALIAGIAVPTLAQTLGWRWAFVIGSAMALPPLIWMPGLEASVGLRSSGRYLTNPSKTVWWLAGSVGLAMFAVAAMGAFYVESSVAAGVDVGTAGTLLAMGSVFGIAGRLLFAWKLGEVSRPFSVTAGLVMVGGLATLSFGLGPTGIGLIAATVIAFGSAWGFNGLFTHAVVRANPMKAAQASGIIVVGAASGGALGPLLFGILVESSSFSTAWTLAAGALLGAGALMLFVSNREKIASVGPLSDSN